MICKLMIERYYIYIYVKFNVFLYINYKLIIFLNQNLIYLYVILNQY